MVYSEIEDTYWAQPAKVFLLPDMVIICFLRQVSDKGRPAQEALLGVQFARGQGRLGGFWAYDGLIYASRMSEGIDMFGLTLKLQRALITRQ